MRKSISEWAFPDGMSLHNRMTLAKEAGFDGFEVALNEDDEAGSRSDLGLLCLQSFQENASRVVGTARRVGIEISGVACGLYWDYSLTADDPEERNKAMDISRALLRSAHLVGVDGVLVIPGNVHATFIPDCPIVPYKVAYGRALVAIKELAPLAEELDSALWRCSTSLRRLIVTTSASIWTLAI